ncbi:hypothetical protein ACMXYO_01100 [Neptuniibacter sp. QD37_6]|uniref:hypothetical protein n=1 Tax=Neptuniibacter sp. QD37_6 TaxID=3398210 RepID=UPI0039F602FE
MEVYNVPDKRRYWVVRADNCKYYEHFIRYGVIALGHLDQLNLRPINSQISKRSYKSLDSSLKKLHEHQDIPSRSTSTQLNQAKTFINDMKVGDWVLTVGRSVIRFGRIISDYRLDSKPLAIIHDHENDRKTVLEYQLRRKVSWGPSIRRDSLPYGLQASLKANQTIFNIDHNWEAIYHSLYPVFCKGDTLYLSAKINTEQRVKNYAVSTLLGFLNELEVISKELDSGLKPDEFDDVFRKYVHSDQITITTKAGFHSPGEIWNAVEGNSKKSMLYLVLGYSMLFGNQTLGFDGLVDLETRQKLWDIVIKRMDDKDINQVINSLQLTAPDVKTNRLESSANDE